VIEHVRFGQDVTQAEFDEQSGRWLVTLGVAGTGALSDQK
jgi:hypothetical protein